jgi:hypothetical protein
MSFRSTIYSQAEQTLTRCHILVRIVYLLSFILILLVSTTNYQSSQHFQISSSFARAVARGSKIGIRGGESKIDCVFFFSYGGVSMFTLAIKGRNPSFYGSHAGYRLLWCVCKTEHGQAQQLSNLMSCWTQWTAELGRICLILARIPIVVSCLIS